MQIFRDTFVASAVLTLAILAISSSTPAQTQKTDRLPDLTLTAIGRHHHPIDTKNRSVQDYFDQGLTFIYAFNHDEATRAFQQAAKLDPVSPMPLWASPSPSAPITTPTSTPPVKKSLTKRYRKPRS